MNKIKDFIGEMAPGRKLLLIWILLFGSCIFTYGLLEYGICKNLQSVYDNPSNVRYVLPSGCLVRTPSGYWVHFDDLNGLELIHENN